MDTDQPHLWEALRYAELNPVRAGMTMGAASWNWSSAPVHCGKRDVDGLLGMAPWQSQWSTQTCCTFLRVREEDSKLTAIRRSTYTGRPLGTVEFIGALEKKTRRRLAPQKGGRPKNAVEGRVSERLTI
jgi:putative transposase